jgi:hypothetical protein
MTRKIQAANNATSTLAAGISNVDTTITIAPGDGAKFPAITGDQFFKATMVKATGEIEVVKVTARATDTLTVERAVEDVAGAATAYAFSSGDRIECRWTSESITDELDRLDAAALNSVANKTANYSVVEADISDLIRVDTTSGGITITLPEIGDLEDDFSVKVSKVTSDGNIVTIARSGSDIINGATSYALTSQWQSAWLIADRSTNTWTAINSSTGSINVVVDTFAGAGAAGPFTLTTDPGSKNNLAVFVGGAYQEKASFTLAGTSLTVGGVVPGGVNVEAIYNTPIGIGVPGDGTVTVAKLADGALAATTQGLAKMADGFLAATSAGLAKMADGFLAATTAGRAKMADLFVTTAKIADAAITLLKLDASLTRQIAQINTIPTPTFSGGAMTIPATDFTLDFRSATLGSGAVTTVSATAAALVVPSGATLGLTSGVASELALIDLYPSANTIEHAIINTAGGADLSETGVIATTAIGTGSDSAGVAYSTTARTSVPYRVVGVYRSTQTTAGTWAQAMSVIQGTGGAFALPKTSMVRLNTSNGYGSTNTVIRRFTNVVANQGSDITYADSATLGASFTINTSGMYAITYVDNSSGNQYAGVSLNSTQLTTNISTIATADRLTLNYGAAATAPATSSWTGYLAAGSVIRPHADGGAAGVAATTTFTIARVS